MMKHINFLLIVVSFGLIVSAYNVSEVVISDTATQSVPKPISSIPAPSRTLTPTGTQLPTKTQIPVKTPTPTVTASATPVLSLPEVYQGTSIPEVMAVISPQNILQLEQLARFGKGFVNEVQYSSGGRLMAVGTSIGVYLYDMRLLEEIAYFSTVESVEQLSFSPDTEALAAALGNQTVWEWDLESGDVIRTIDGIQVAYNANGNLIVIQIVDEETRSIRVYDLYRDINLLEIDNAIRAYKFWDAFLFSPDASKLFIPERNGPGMVEMFSLITGELLYEFGPSQEDGTWEMLCTTVNGMAVSENGEYFSIGCIEYGNIYIWRIDGEFVQWIDADIWAVEELALSSDGQLVVGALELGGVSLWRVSDGKMLRQMPGTHGTINAITFSRNGLRVVAGYDNGLLRQWRTADAGIVGDIHTFTPTGSELVFSPEGDRLMNVAGNGVQFIDVETGLPEATLIARITDVLHLGNRGFAPLFRSGPMGYIEKVIIADNWEYLYVIKDDGRGYLWQVESSQLLYAFDWDDQTPLTEVVQNYNPTFAQKLALYDSIYGVLSPDWKFFAKSGEGSTGLLKNLATDEYCPRYNLSAAPVFSADSSFLAVPYQAGINIYHTENCGLHHHLGGHSSQISAVAFSPDGRILASGSVDGTIILWDLQDGSLLRSLRGHTGFHYDYVDLVYSTISGLAFSPDGRYLASGGAYDGAIRLWGIYP